MADTKTPTATLENINDEGSFDAHVAYLAKDPTTFALTPTKLDVIHMNLGIVDEIDELEECVGHIANGGPDALETHVENFLEELGDLYFYATGLKNAIRSTVIEQVDDLDDEGFDKAFTQVVGKHITAHGVMSGNYANLRIPGLNVATVINIIFGQIDSVRPVLNETVKRYTIYDQQESKEGQPMAVIIFEQSAKLIANIMVMAESLSIGMDVVREYNFNKLAKRYPEGYTDTSAQARADKDVDQGQDNVTPFKPESAGV